MQVTIDQRGPVWRWQFTGNEALLRAALATAPSGSRVQLAFAGELRALDEPVDVQIPADVVDAAPAESDEVPTPGAPESAAPVVDQVFPGQSEACTVERRTLEVATQAWMGSHTSPPTEAEPVPGYLASESQWYDLVDGVVVAAPGGPCV